MKRTTIFTLALVLAAGVGLALVSKAGPATAKPTTVEGQLVDSKCYLAMGEKGNDHGSMKGCGTACAKGGNPVGILTAQGRYFPLIVAAPLVADHVGGTVPATGDLKQGSLVPTKLEVKKGQKWEEVRLSSTM